VFQLRGLRNILKMKTTYVERGNSNAEVFRRANEEIQNETPEGKTPKKIKPFVTCYLNSRMKRLARVHKMKHDHAVRHITFAPDPKKRIVPWNPPNRRVGRPRFKWVTKTIKDMWHNIRHEHAHITQAFDRDNSLQHEAIKQSIDSLASDPSYLFKTS